MNGKTSPIANNKIALGVCVLWMCSFAFFVLGGATTLFRNSQVHDDIPPYLKKMEEISTMKWGVQTIVSGHRMRYSSTVHAITHRFCCAIVYCILRTMCFLGVVTWLPSHTHAIPVSFSITTPLASSGPVWTLKIQNSTLVVPVISYGLAATEGFKIFYTSFSPPRQSLGP